jgi:hypothetical protein
VTDYLTAPPEEMDMDEDDDEFESMLGAAAEGARASADLYDPYGTHAHSWSPSGYARARRAHPAPPAAPPPTALESRVAEPAAPPPDSPPAPNRSGPWTVPHGVPSFGAAALGRQPPLRRPPRASRTVDFNEFTSRRRSTTRQLSAQEPGDAGADGAAEDPVVSAVLSRHMTPDGALVRHAHSARRFFPFSRRRPAADSVPWPEPPTEGIVGEDALPFLAMQPSAEAHTGWFSFPTPAPQPDSGDASTSDDALPSAAPRLRRGGLRAPESLLTYSGSVDRSAVEQHVGLVPASYPTPTPTDSQNEESGGGS